MSDTDHPHNLEDPTEPDSQSSTEIRKIKRAQRNTFPTSTQQEHSEALEQLIIQDKVYKNSQHIACYLANDGEIDPVKIIEHAWSDNKKVYLPILSPSKNSLYFVAYTSKSKFKVNRFGIPEPICQPSQWKKASQMDLLLIPLVAFDVSGNRIGMGGGFYDRTLAFLPQQQSNKPRLIGLAHEIQKVDHLNRQEWDIPLDVIITEKKIYKPGSV